MQTGSDILDLRGVGHRPPGPGLPNGMMPSFLRRNAKFFSFHPHQTQGALVHGRDAEGPPPFGHHVNGYAKVSGLRSPGIDAIVRNRSILGGSFDPPVAGDDRIDGGGPPDRIVLSRGS